MNLNLQWMDKNHAGSGLVPHL